MLKQSRWYVALILGALLGAAGCQTYGDLLQRGQGYYEQNQYERALSVFRHLEADEGSLSSVELVRYCYLRGMTDYRLGYETDARYWLGLAKAASQKARGALLQEETERLETTLAALNDVAFGLKKEPSVQALGQACKWTSECESGFTCKDGTCVAAE